MSSCFRSLPVGLGCTAPLPITLAMGPWGVGLLRSRPHLLPTGTRSWPLATGTPLRRSSGTSCPFRAGPGAPTKPPTTSIRRLRLRHRFRLLVGHRRVMCVVLGQLELKLQEFVAATLISPRHSLLITNAIREFIANESTPNDSLCEVLEALKSRETHWEAHPVGRFAQGYRARFLTKDVRQIIFGEPAPY